MEGLPSQARKLYFLKIFQKKLIKYGRKWLKMFKNVLNAFKHNLILF